MKSVSVQELRSMEGGSIPVWGVAVIIGIAGKVGGDFISGVIEGVRQAAQGK